MGEILTALEDRAPGGTAEEWDNVGLLVGDPAWKTRGAVVCIDLTEEALRTALGRGYRLIINHHPCIFPKSRGLSRLVPGKGPALSGLILEAYRNGVAVIASHTNFDQCALEVVKTVSHGLGVTPRGRLLEKGEEPLRKLVVFVPVDHAEKVRSALCEAGAGRIGNYDQCSFGLEGEGTFRGDPGTQPFLGKPGDLERVREIRLETIFPKGLQSRVLKALFATHPYEEVAFDVYPVLQSSAGQGLISGLGYGFWGDLPAARPFSEIAESVKSLFKIGGFFQTSPPPARVKRLAFVAGKGASFVQSAAEFGCDLFITGEAGYHTALDANRRGMGVMELGHRESERFFVTTMEAWLAELGLRGIGIHSPTQQILC